MHDLREWSAWSLVYKKKKNKCGERKEEEGEEIIEERGRKEKRGKEDKGYEGRKTKEK